MDLSEILRAEVDAEIAVRRILLDLQKNTGKKVEFVKVENSKRRNCEVEINLSKAEAEQKIAAARDKRSKRMNEIVKSVG